MARVLLTTVDDRVGACCHVFGQAHQVLTVGFLLLLFSVTYILLSPYLDFIFFVS